MAFVITEDCLICGTCYEICPTDSVVEHEWYYRIDESCVDCGACMRVCPNTAIRKTSSQKAGGSPSKERGERS